MQEGRYRRGGAGGEVQEERCRREGGAGGKCKAAALPAEEGEVRAEFGEGDCSLGPQQEVAPCHQPRQGFEEAAGGLEAPEALEAGVGLVHLQPLQEGVQGRPAPAAGAF